MIRYLRGRFSIRFVVSSTRLRGSHFAYAFDASSSVERVLSVLTLAGHFSCGYRSGGVVLAPGAGEWRGCFVAWVAGEKLFLWEGDSLFLSSSLCSCSFFVLFSGGSTS